MSVTKLIIERKLLSGLGKWVSLPVPIYESSGRSCAFSDQPIAGYRKLPGIPADLAEEADRPLVARQLGLFLDTLHSYPFETAKEAKVPEVRDMVTHWRNKAFEGLKKIVDNGSKLEIRSCDGYWLSERNGVEQAMTPIIACLPLPPVTWGSRTRCEPRCERHLRIVPPGFPGHTVKIVPHCECFKRCTVARAWSTSVKSVRR